MTGKRVALIQIGLALIFAGIIILVGFVNNNSSENDTIIGIIIAIWFIPFTYLLKAGDKKINSKQC